MTIKIKLKHKINVLEKETDTIELREPTTRDVRRLGMPIAIGQSGEAGMNMEVCAKYLVALSNLTDGDIDKLAMDDFIEAAMRITTFFNIATPETQSVA